MEMDLTREDIISGKFNKNSNAAGSEKISGIIFSNLKITQADNIEDIFGFKAKDVLGISIAILFPEYQPDGNSSIELIKKSISKLEKGGRTAKELILKHSHGFLFNQPVEFEKIAADTFGMFISDYEENSTDKLFINMTDKDQGIHHLLQITPVMFRMSNENNEFYYFSKQWLQFTGNKLKEELEYGWENHVYKEDRKYFLQTLKKAFYTITKYESSYRLIRHDGEKRWIYESGIPLFDKDGNFIGFLSVSVDVTGIREVETQFTNQQDRLKLLTEDSPVMFKMSDEKNRYYYFSKQWLKYRGISLKQQLNGNWMDHIHPEDYKQAIDCIDSAFPRKTKFELSYRLRNNQGDYRWVLDTGIPVFGHKGDFTGYISAVIDIHERKVAEERKSRSMAMIESAKKLQASLDQSELIAVSIDKDFRIINCNSRFLELTDLPEAGILYKEIFEFIEFRPSEKGRLNPLEELIENKIYSHSFEAVIKSQFRERFIVRFSSILLYSEGEEIPLFILIGENITEKRKVREALEKSNEQLKDLFDNANDLIQIFTLDGKFLFVNKTWKEKLGYSNHEIPNIRFEDIIDQNQKENTLSALNTLVEGKKLPKLDTILISKSGTRIYVTGSVNCNYRNGKVKEFQGIFYDITDRVKVEKAQNIYYRISNLAINSANLQTMFAGIHEEIKNIFTADNFYIAMHDPENNNLKFPYYIDENRSGSSILSSRKYENGITEYAISHKKSLLLSKDDLLKLEENGEIKIKGKLPEKWLGVPLQLQNRVIGIIAVQSYDNPAAYNKKDLDLMFFISGQIANAIDRKKKELKIKEQAGRLQSIIESGTHLIWSVDRTYQFTSGNRNFKDFIQFNLPGELKTKNQIIDPGSINLLPFWKEKYDRAFRGEIVQFESKFIDLRNQTESWKNIFLSPIYIDEDIIEEISGIAHDITENKNAELALTKSEEKFRNIFESFQDIYFRCDFKGRIIMLSPSVKDMLGYDPYKMVGKDITNYYLYTKKNRDLVKEIVRKKSIRNFEASLVDKNGKILQFICNLRLVYDNNIKAAAMEGIARDITRLKDTNNELKQAKELAEKSLRVKELFLANMSHEIRTPMNGIIGVIDLLERTVITKDQKNYINTIKKSSETLLNILNDILDLSKIEAGKMQLKKEPVNLKNTLEKIYGLYNQQAMSKNIKLIYHLNEKLPDYVLIDETRFLQVISNLVSNAIKFTEGGGSIDIDLKKAKVPGKKHMIKCVVSDSGIGISHDNIKQLFSLFSQIDNTTTKSYGGTGLGLAISKELCKLMGGKIGVYSTMGHGSSFWFTFEAEPTTKEAALKHKITESAIEIEGFFMNTRPKILLVDDNKVNRQIAGEILKKSGCIVDLAENGKQSLEFIKQYSYDLIFMDIQMPEMDGVTATRILKEMNIKNLPPIVAMTAYSMKEDKERFLSQGLDDYISKPIRTNELLNKVGQWTRGKNVSINQQVNNEPGDHAILNLETVNQLRNLGGDDMIHQVFNDFIRESRDQLKACKEAIETKDFDKIRAELHTMKGNAGTLGVEKLSENAKYIEKKIKQDQYESIEQDINLLNLSFYEFEEKYHQFLNDR